MHNFKKFLSRCLIMLGLIALVTVPLFAFYFYDTCHFYQDQDCRDEAAGELELLILGSSEGQRGIMTIMLDERMCRSYNLSGSMMTLQGRLSLLQSELERNPIRTVIVEVSYDTLIRDREEEGPEGDLQVLGRLNSPWQRIRFAAEALYTDELPFIFYDTMQRGWKSAQIALDLIDMERQGSTYADRGFVSTYAYDMTRTDAEYRRSYHSAPWGGPILEENVAMLQTIVDFCQERDIRVVLTTTPVSKYAVMKHTGLQAYHDFYTAFAQDNGCEYYDGNLLRDRDTLFLEDQAYNDDVHLSGIGSWYFTDRLVALMQAHEAGQDTSEQFFDSFAELEATWLD